MNFLPEHREYVKIRYLNGVPPRELVHELDSKYSVKLTSAQLRQWLSRSGITADRAKIDYKAQSMVSDAGIATIAKARA